MKLKAALIVLLIVCTVLILAVEPGTAVAAGKTTEKSAFRPLQEPLAAVIDVRATGVPIHRYLYGQFIELFRNNFEGGLWAEMLGDRKFFYPVNSSKKQVPINTRKNIGRWWPVGPDEFVVMDKKNAYVGEHSPRIKLESNTPHGIRQGALALRKDASYTGRIILSSDAGAKVKVSLVWGPAPNERQTVVFNSLTHEYNKYPLNFTAGGDTDDGVLEITGTGTGSFHIGAVSLMPADNIKGFRADIIRLLREMDSAIYRWPGGNMVSAYEWRDGIGDPDKRPPRYDYVWRALEPNDVGTDEFMTLCSLLNIDPYICVNSGFGDAYSAARWVEYVNGSTDTPMGKLRAANGHPEPYNVRWWGIGNEMYGEWQFGHMAIDQYVIKHNMFARAMWEVDSTITLVASGANPFEMSTVARYFRPPLPSKLPFRYGTPEDWSGNLLAHSSDYFQVIAEHFYPFLNKAFDVEKQKFVDANDPLVDQVRRVANRVRCVVEAWDEYLQRMPELKNKNITIALDEWSSSLQDERGKFMAALCAAEVLHEIFRYTHIIGMSGYTSAPTCLTYNKTDVAFQPNGLVFKLYRQHFGTIPVKVSGNSPQHPVQGTIGVDKPTVTSGSDTWPLDVAAALSSDRKKVTVAIVNPTESVQEINISFAGAELGGRVRRWQIAAQHIDAINLPGQKPAVEIVQYPVSTVGNLFRIDPISINMYEFGVK
ncbi:MAG: alpha-N-arabinofuranosidase [Actinobacteria bacterium]|nr:alpha-N-arabinofuranosidase [Actinomycetota bacterium]